MHYIVYLVMMIGLGDVELSRLENALEVSLLTASEGHIPGCVAYTYSLVYMGDVGLPKTIDLCRSSDSIDFAAEVRQRDEATDELTRGPTTYSMHPRFEFALGHFVGKESRTHRLKEKQRIDGHVLVEKRGLTDESVLVEFLVDAEACQWPSGGFLLIFNQEEMSTGFGTSKNVYRLRKNLSVLSDQYDK